MSPGELWTGESWVSCGSWWVSLRSWRRQGAHSTTVVPKQRRVVTLLFDLCLPRSDDGTMSPAEVVEHQVWPMLGSRLGQFHWPPCRPGLGLGLANPVELTDVSISYHTIVSFYLPNSIYQIAKFFLYWSLVWVRRFDSTLDLWPQKSREQFTSILFAEGPTFPKYSVSYVVNWTQQCEC